MGSEDQWKTVSLVEKPVGKGFGSHKIVLKLSGTWSDDFEGGLRTVDNGDKAYYSCPGPCRSAGIINLHK